MFDAISKFIADLARSDDVRTFSEDDQRLAAAALLYHVIAVDGLVTEDERTLLADLLMRRFGLGIDAAEKLVNEAEAADREAVDLYGFTSILKRKLDEPGRERIVEMMWKLTYADGTVHEFEDNVIWRVAELLGVSSQARIRLKQAVRTGLGR
ncbi:MAG: TerB family tellurite resistance protein [Bauldia sp.]